MPKLRFKLTQRVPIILVTGFLDSGKTSFIARLVKTLRDNAPKAKLALLTCEKGEAELDIATLAELVAFNEISRPEKLTRTFLTEMLRETSPDMLIVEYNGVWPLAQIKAAIPPCMAYLQYCLNVQSVAAADRQITGMGSLSAQVLSESEGVLLNFYSPSATQETGLTGQAVDAAESAQQKIAEVLCRRLQAYNSRLQFFCWRKKAESNPADFAVSSAAGAVDELKFAVPENLPPLPSGLLRKITDAGIGGGLQFLLVLLAVWAAVLLRAWFALPGLENWQAAGVAISKYFLALMFQIVPFMLMAALISSVLQVTVSDLTVQKWLKRPWYISVPLTLGLGSVLPICDCGLVPIITRLLRKGVSRPIAFLFFVASTVTNPLVILSTFYAFPGQPLVYVWRLGLGLMTAVLLSGAVCLQEWSWRKKGELREKESVVADLVCTSGYIGELSGNSGINKAVAVFRHTIQEFMTLMPYVVAGALLSAIVHELFTASSAQFLSRNTHLAVLLTVPLAVFLAVCANSNAFLAKNFTSFLPAPAVLIYMAFSPLLDIKNLLLWKNGLGKKAVGEYVVTLLIIMLLLFGVLYVLPRGVLPRLGGFL